MFGRIGLLLVSLALNNLALAEGYSLPVLKSGSEFEQVERQLGNKNLVTDLLKKQKLLEEAQANQIQQMWLTEPTGNTAFDIYQQERRQRAEVNNQLAQLRGYVNFEQVSSIRNLANTIQGKLQAEQASFYLPVYLFSTLELPFSKEDERTGLLEVQRAAFVTANYGLEQLFSQQEITNGQLVKDITRVTNSGRLELEASLNKCTLHNLEDSTSLTLELSRHRFYPFAPSKPNHLQGSFVRQTDKPLAKAQVASLPLTQVVGIKKMGISSQQLQQCDEVFNQQLNNQQPPEDLIEKQQQLKQLAKKLTSKQALLTQLVHQVFASPYAIKCTSLACIANNLNQPLEVPDTWPKVVVLQVETYNTRINHGLFITLSLELPDKLKSHLQTVRTSISEEINTGNYSLNQSQQLEFARISKLTLLPYSGNNNKLGVFARIELIAPSTELPQKKVTLGPHTLIFREVYLNNQPHWIAENSLNNQVFNYFLEENKQYQQHFLIKSCQRRADFANCLTPRGLEWFLRWINEQGAAEQFSLPDCRTWDNHLSSLDASSCRLEQGQLQGLCEGVRDVCSAASNLYFALGHCDTCGGPAKISTKAEPYLASPQNGIRLQLRH